MRATRAALALLIAVIVSAPLAAGKPPAFSNGSLKGSYGFMLNKWRSDPNSNPEGLVGIFSFDGAGNVAITSFVDNNGGTVTSGTGTGTYNVAANGTGSIKLSLSNGDAGTFTITLNSKGQGFQMMLTTCDKGCSSNVISGTAIATQVTSFTNANLKGGYEILSENWPTSQNPNALNVLGVITFDGAGKLKATLVEDNAGQVSNLNAAGTYSVNSDGSGSFTLKNKGNSITFAVALNTAGKDLQFLLTACTGGCNSLQTGTATHQ